MRLLYARFAAGALLLALPRPGHAQTSPEPTPASRFYVGLGAFHSNFQLLGHRQQHGETGFPVPLQLTGGYLLRPRLALELGAAYSGSTSAYTYEATYDNGGAAPYYEQFNGTLTRRVTNLSALARYALRQPARRLQVEALGGFTVVHGRFYSRGSSGDNFSGSLQTTPFASRYSATELLLTAGLGVRYRFSPRLALNFDVATNRNLVHPHVYNGYTGSAALGVRYRFGRL